MLDSLVESLCVLLALIFAALWLRRRGVLRPSDSPMLSRIITDLMLPALIFASLSRHPLHLQHLPPALIMLATTLFTLSLSWVIGWRIGLSPTKLGSFILVAGIGSSSTLGYSLIGQVFPGNTEAAYDAVIIGEIGAILPLFIVGVPLAIHFGGSNPDSDAQSGAHWRELREFVRSPIFVAMGLGFAVSFIELPDWRATAAFYRVLGVLGTALPVFVAMTIGLMLRPVSVKSFWLPMSAVLVLKLLIEPFMVAELASLSHMAELERNVLIIEASMPSGTLAAILARRYGCDGGFASAVVVVSYVASLVSVPLISFMLA